MGHPIVTTPVEAHGHVTPIAANALTADVTLRVQGLQNLRLDSVAQTTSGKTLSDSLIYSNGHGYWSGEQKHTGKLYSAARYSHPQLLPLQVCSLDFLATNLSLAFASSQAGDPPNAVRLRTYIDMRDSTGKTDPVEEKLSSMVISLDPSTFLPTSATSFAFDPSNLNNSTLWTTTYSAYADQQGLALPTVVIESIGARHIRTITWNSIVVGAGFDSSIFTLGGK